MPSAAVVDELIDNDGVFARPTPRCPRCAREGRLLHQDLRDLLFGAPGVWSVRQCTDDRCGIGWVDPMPLPEDLGKLYSTYYTHAGNDGAIAPSDTPAGALRSSALRRGIAKLLPWRKAQLLSKMLHLEDLPPGRVLEVGCGSGAFLRDASAAGWRAVGVDFDAAAVAAARRCPGVEVLVGDIHDVRLGAGEFDAVVMNNVIEHLPEPACVFARCAELLRAGGRLVMVTPNIDARCHAMFGRDWRGLEAPRHLILYNARALRAFARAAGFCDAQAFSPISGGVELMVPLSLALARAAGRPRPDVDVRRLKIMSLLSWLVGEARGEWVVLVAHR